MEDFLLSVYSWCDDVLPKAGNRVLTLTVACGSAWGSELKPLVLAPPSWASS